MRPMRVLAGVILLAAMVATAACTENSRRGAAIGGVAGAGWGAATGGGILSNAAKGAAIGGAGGYVYDKVK
jgi:hypothetical protein